MIPSYALVIISLSGWFGSTTTVVMSTVGYQDKAACVSAAKELAEQSESAVKMRGFCFPYPSQITQR